MLRALIACCVFLASTMMVSCGGTGGSDDTSTSLRNMMGDGYYTFRAYIKNQYIDAHYSHRFLNTAQDRVLRDEYSWDSDTSSWNKSDSTQLEYHFYSLKGEEWQEESRLTQVPVSFDDSGDMIYQPNKVELRLSGMEIVDLSEELISDFVDITVFDAPYPIDSGQLFSRGAEFYTIGVSVNRAKYALDGGCESSTDINVSDKCEIRTDQVSYADQDEHGGADIGTVNFAESFEELFERTRIVMNFRDVLRALIFSEDGTINILNANTLKIDEEVGKWTSHEFGEISIYRLELPLEGQEGFDKSRFLTVYDGELVWGTVAEEGEKMDEHTKYFNDIAIQDILSQFRP